MNFLYIPDCIILTIYITNKICSAILVSGNSEKNCIIIAINSVTVCQFEACLCIGEDRKTQNTLFREQKYHY